METSDLLKLILTALTSAAGGAWTVWLYLNKKRQERKRQNRLYINPFMLAAEKLQSRLYNILKRNGLFALHRAQPDGSYAEDTLYLVASYFAWACCLERNGPYIEDDGFRKLVDNVRQRFATDDNGFGAFCFFRNHQEEIGQHALKRISDGPAEYDAVSSSEFKQQLASSSSPLSNIPGLSNALNALKNAHGVKELEGRERLIKVQDGLVDLLSYLEEKENYSVFAGTRKKAGSIASENTTRSQISHT